MIGDWVQIVEPCKYAGAIGRIKTLIDHKDDENAYFKVFLKSNTIHIGIEDICSEDIRPIPLIPEILEKNGFNLLKDAYRMSDPFWSYSNRSVLVDVTIIRTNNVKVIDWFNIKVSTRNDIKQVSIWGVKYIHELQHALRLCGITREIII